MYFFFYYPIGVEREHSAPPWASWSLMALMMGVFLYFELNPMRALLRWEWWVFFPQQPLKPGLFFAVFNHATWLHLIGNLVYLWTFGPSMERALGWRRFLLVFIFLGAMANLSQALVSTYLLTRYAGLGVVGASGALSGLMGLFLLRYPTARIRVAWALFSPLHGLARSGVVRISSYIAIGGWIGLQVVYAMVKALGGLDGTAYGAHFGGLCLGLLLGLAYRFPRAGRIYRHRQRVRSRMNRGDWLGAYEATQALLDSEHPEDLTVAARVSRLIGFNLQSSELFRRAVSSALAQGDEMGATHIYAEALRFHPQMHFLEDSQYQLALALDRLKLHSAAIQAMANFRSLFQDSERLPLILLRAARLEEVQDPDRARQLYEEQLQRFPHSPYGNLARKAIQTLDAA